MAKATVNVRVTDTEEFRNVLALLGEAYEALVSARSDGWDLFSEATRAEVVDVMDRIQGLAP